MASIELLQWDDRQVKAAIRGVDRSYANALRRFAISEVPTLAIDEVVILENSTTLYDELIAHRLGLIPLKTDLSKYVLPEKCDCGSPLGCSRCRVLVVLDAEAEDRVKIVYSADLVSEDKYARPISENIPIVKLAPQQKIKLEAYAKLGRGRDHAKWQAASVSVLKESDRQDEYILYIESVGSLRAVEILHESARILHEKLDQLLNKTKAVGGT